MNRKGFTMIELLAVIIVLGLVFTITFPNLTSAFKSGKLKSEEAFVNRVSEAVDSYVTLNSSDITFNNYGEGTKTYGGQEHTVTIYIGTIYVNNIISAGIISANDYKNPNNEETNCSTNLPIEVYRDSDFVYCHKIPKTSIDCLTEEYKNKIDGDYIVNTCTWSK